MEHKPRMLIARLFRLIMTFLLTIVFFLFALWLVASIDGIGHVVVARFFGDSTAYYFLIKRTPTGSYCMGCWGYHNVSSDIEALFVDLSGLIFTQFFAILLSTALKTKLRNYLPRPWITILVVLLLLDLPFQLLQAFRPLQFLQSLGPLPQTHSVPKSGVDLADFIYLLSLRTNIKIFVIQIALVSAAIIYLLFMAWLLNGALTSSRKTVTC
ncbi:MAG: hypothetical protein U0350_50770 [Caldilineaceae bacterium]